MKHMLKKSAIAIMLMPCFPNFSVAQDYFKTIKIGTQVWMAENLNVDTFRNGDRIPEAKTPEDWKNADDKKQPAWCYYANDPSNGTRYGRLYNWYAVNDQRGLAPKGWHIPSDTEWTTLTACLGGDDAAGTKMKSTTAWAEGGNGTNESGFSGLPSGFRYNTGLFSFIGAAGGWWSSTEDGNMHVRVTVLMYDEGIADRGTINYGDGFSVRCVRN